MDDDRPLTVAEIEQLINVSILAVYERAYNQAIDDVLAKYDFEDILRSELQGMKKCSPMSSLNQ